MEERGLAKGNPPKGTAPRTQGRIGWSNALERVREAARRDRKQRFTALFQQYLYVGSNNDVIKKKIQEIKEQEMKSVPNNKINPTGNSLCDFLQRLMPHRVILIVPHFQLVTLGYRILSPPVTW
ncbi:MAG: hypothetical protein FJ117_07245 [Deltaproteobacteria bacterium]|nr:hypothetical protein [Deltaproteobacteria bacterium]